MKEKNLILSKSRDVIERRRSYAVNVSKDREDEVSEKIPEYAELKKEFASMGVKLAMLSIKGQANSKEYEDSKKRMVEIEEEKKKLLAKNGYGEDYLTAGFRCPRCKDTGNVKNEKGEEQMCSCLKEIYGNMLLEESGLPVKGGFELFDEKIFAEIDKETANQRLLTAKAIVNDFPKDANRLIIGKTGVGKTYLASLTGAELCKKGIQAIYVTMPSLMNTMIYFGEDEELQIQRDTMRKVIMEADMLIIDELGTEKMSDKKQDILAELIDLRLPQKDKGTIVITNCTLREILTNYGERIFSRFTTMKIDGFELQEGKDLRKKLN